MWSFTNGWNARHWVFVVVGTGWIPPVWNLLTLSLIVLVYFSSGTHIIQKRCRWGNKMENICQSIIANLQRNHLVNILIYSGRLVISDESGNCEICSTKNISIFEGECEIIWSKNLRITNWKVQYSQSQWKFRRSFSRIFIVNRYRHFNFVGTFASSYILMLYQTRELLWFVVMVFTFPGPRKLVLGHFQLVFLIKLDILSIPSLIKLQIIGLTKKRSS